MADQLPITFQEFVKLPELGIDVSNISFNTLTLQSDKFICVREKTAQREQVCIVDLEDTSRTFRRPITADSAIMNPENKIIALKAGRNLQVFNLEMKAKVKSCMMNEDVQYWRWITAFDVALVTEKSVFHWSIEGTAAPVKQFDRHANLAGTQIIAYTTNAKMNWMALIGISAPQGRIVGSMQLYNKDRGASQPIEAHAAEFSEIWLEGAAQPTQVFAFASRAASGSKLHVVEIDHVEGNPPFQKRTVEMMFPPEAVNDFPVAMQAGPKYELVYMVTKFGFIHLYDLATGACVFTNRISGDTVFVTAKHDNGIIAVNRKGQVLSVCVNEETVIPYILQNSGNVELAFRMASRANLPGADQLYVQRFQQLMSQGQINEAAKMAANSPRGMLRTENTINQLKHLQSGPGQLSPILQYFATILEKGELNRHESIELARPVLASNRKALLEKWLKEDKLECSEELGDIVQPHDATLALSVYLRANVPAKVVLCFAQSGQFDKIVLYCKKVGFSPDWVSLLMQISRADSEKACDFALSLAKEDPPLVTADQVVGVFASQNLVQQTTRFLLEALKDNRESEAHLQTKLLEINLLNAPPVADAILGNNMFSHFDRPYIAQLAEKAGLYQRALELYDNLDDIKRVAVHTEVLSGEWLVNYFGSLSVTDSLAVLRQMLDHSTAQNLQTVVQVATKYSELLGAQNIIELLEEYRCSEGLYFYLGSVVNVSEDPAVVFKYIQAAVATGQLKEVERVVRDNNHYDAEKVKNYLKEASLPDQLPLIIVCDRFDYVHDLVLYLYSAGMAKYIEVYVQQVNPARLPQVVGALLEVDCDENVVKSLVAAAPAQFSVADLVDEVEKRNRLKILHRWLEARASEGSQDAGVYNALAKIYIDSNYDPERFLSTNKLYDPRVVGAYSERRDPGLAFLAYSQGECDDELLRLTSENAMFKQQSRYLIKRRDLGLWAKALVGDEQYPLNQSHRRQLVDQVVSYGLPEADDPEEVSVCVKAFMAASLPQELIELLERIILEPTAFSNNNNLQNLLILTALKVDPSRVADYISRLSNFDAPDIAEICINNGLHEEAFDIYKRFEVNADAIGVLIEHIGSLDRAYEYAERCDQPAVWSRLGKAQLDGLRIQEAINSYIRADDPANYAEVIDVASHAGKFDDLVRFLLMARKKVREPAVESELLFAYAKTERLSDLEDMLRGPNIAQVQKVGDRCYDEGLFEAARLLFQNVSNWARLASTLVRLGDYQSAVDCGRKANSTLVWKDVHAACIAEKEFRLAQICGLHLVVHAEELVPMIALYESSGHVGELCALIESGLGLERAHMGMFTELAILYCKYRPEQIMGHLKLYWSRINIPKVIRACEAAHLWPELVFLYVHYDEFDNATQTIIAHSADAWEHASFKDIVVKVSNVELYYKALRFYLAEQPLLLTDLLNVMMPRVDHTRVVSMFLKSDNIPLIKKYLVAAQSTNNKAVNEAYNDLLIEEEDFVGLRNSIDNHDNFDGIELAQRLEKHELLEFRRIAAHLYNQAKRWRQSLSLSKKDKLYKDAMTTARQSANAEIAEDLLRYFVESGNPACFSACLFTCYDLVRSDVVMELAWRHGLANEAMPYFINLMREYQSKVDTLAAEVSDLKVKVERNSAGAPAANAGPNQLLGPAGLGGRLMLTHSVSPAPTPGAAHIPAYVPGQPGSM
ncbi:Clathrin heavy chain [Coemansia biformis]|uniref:Clathrin heavy chain n=1 Tax=Coemansia biformis TaxID=1286918 RepID=A0A9W8D0Q0_9FUNG|nr:Clathrin heavy chain [Coemansia biformis]